MEEFVEQTLLYDFYGELLTEHQKRIYEDHVMNDLSVSEIAADQGISRQAAHDMIKRCRHILEGYEEKLHLVERFVKIREQIRKADEILADGSTENLGATERTKLRELTGSILETL